MPILLHGKCHKNFAAAVRTVMRWKRIGKQKASAYVAVTMRRQHGSARIRQACGVGRRKAATWAPRRLTRREKAQARFRTGARKAVRDIARAVVRSGRWKARMKGGYVLYEGAARGAYRKPQRGERPGRRVRTAFGLKPRCAKGYVRNPWSGRCVRRKKGQSFAIGNRGERGT